MSGDTTTTKLSRAELEETANYGPYDVAKLHNVYGEGVCLHCDYIEPRHATDCSWQLATDALAYMTVLEKAEKDISFALGSVLTDAALLEDLREEIRKVLP